MNIIGASCTGKLPFAPLPEAIGAIETDKLEQGQLLRRH